MRIVSLLSCELSKSFWELAGVGEAAYGNGTVDVSWFTKTFASFLRSGGARYRPGWPRIGSHRSCRQP